MRGSSARAALGLVFAIVASIGVVPALAPVPVAGAAPSLTMAGATTYDVLPEAGRIAVTVQLKATNHLKDTVTKRYFFKVGYLTVLPGTSNFKLTGASAKAKVSVIATTDAYTNLKLDFGADLAAGKSIRLILTYEIRDAGGAPDRAVRISPSLVSFAAWAVSTPETPGASVDVRFPIGYSVNVRRGPLAGPTPDGTANERWSSGPIEQPLDFVADIAADRPTDYAETRRTVALRAGPATILLRSWPDDPAWRDRVGALVQRALPILEREIGVPWPVDGPLAVHEALVRSTGGYAGLFDPAAGRMEIAYAASDGVVLHELAHAWFNGGLVADRWIAEGFAAYYAELAAKELGIAPAAPVVPADPADAVIPLNAWSPGEGQNPASEAWAYAASLDLARDITRRAGSDAMRAIWSNAARGVGAYQPVPAATEPASGPPDWRGFLDLLESETGQDFTDLWRQQVARPEDVSLLADRAATRGYYLRTVGLAEEWRLSPTTRLAMRAWRFDIAREQLLATDAVLAQRDALLKSAAAAGVTLPDTLRVRFEGDGGLAAAAAEAQAEQATVAAIAAAEAARPTEHGAGERLIIDVGLLFADPEGRLALAKSALTAGKLEEAYPAAQAAATAWQRAPEIGRSRIVSTLLLLAAIALFAGIVRQQRWRRPTRASATPPADSAPPPA